MKRLQIGTVTAMFTPEEARITSDDRQELVKTLSLDGGSIIPGVAVVDVGYCETGEVISYSGVKFKAADWSTVLGYATARTPITVVSNGVAKTNCRLVLREWTESKRFNVVTANLEIWRL